MDPRPDIRQLSEDQLIGIMVEANEKPFRAKQVQEWLWKHHVKSIDEMTNLSVKLRQILHEKYTLHHLTEASSQISNDATIKSAFSLFDGNLIEGVLIPATDRMTACVSSQVGCSLTCKFCATGYMGRKRNLEAHEIVEQVVKLDEMARKHYDTPLSNIVYMGMGEPLLNYQNVLKSIYYITSEKGLGWSPKRITVSTAGIAKMIKKLADDQVKFNLALSLHAADDTKRNTIMPINESNTLENLMESLRYFFQKTKNRITYEYIVFDGINDQINDAENLYKLTRDFPVRVNIIEYNPIQEASYKNAQSSNLQAFVDHLSRKNVNVHIRKSRGKDIDAACGQLANKTGLPLANGEKAI